MGRSWCKVSSSLDSHPRIRRAGNLGRQVFEFALRRNAELDRNGVVPAEHLEADYLADVLMLTKEQAVSGLSSCVRTCLLALDNGNYVITGWDDDWGKRPMTEAERKRNQRANKRDSTSVTKCPDSNVTESDCPECHGSEERRGEEIRREEKRESSVVEPVARRSRPVGKSDGTPAELAAARRVLDKLSEIRGGDVTYEGAKEHVRLIVNQLRAGRTEGELYAVIAHCADPKPQRPGQLGGLGWRGDPKMHTYLRPKTLFGPQKIDDYLDEARSRYSDLIARKNAELAQQDPQPTLSLLDGGKPR